jgi:hypothetical protein
MECKKSNIDCYLLLSERPVARPRSGQASRLNVETGRERDSKLSMTAIFSSQPVHDLAFHSFGFGQMAVLQAGS